PVGWYIRSHLDETPEFLANQRAESMQAAPEGKAPGLGRQWGSLLLAVGIVAQSTVGVYILQLYMPMYAVKQLHMAAAGGAATRTCGWCRCRGEPSSAR
ncbi:hypothetical protein PPH41_45340, partial [Burkholderia gladioli]|nr:hypothetical protein [Burkholderia gladioli]